MDEREILMICGNYLVVSNLCYIVFIEMFMAEKLSFEIWFFLLAEFHSLQIDEWVLLLVFIPDVFQVLLWEIFTIET